MKKDSGSIPESFFCNEMKILIPVFVSALSLSLLSGPLYSAEPTLAEKICAAYGKITTISCMARKTTEINGRKARMLSRIYYRKPDGLHVENVAPMKRRIMSDGERFYLSQEDWVNGYSVPLGDLPDEWRISQQSVPATAMEHLLRLKGVEEKVMEGTPEFPLRRGYQMPNVLVVLSCDEKGRLNQIEFFGPPDFKESTAVYRYDEFIKVDDDCWLAARRRAEIIIDGDQIFETMRFDNLKFNEPVNPAMFDPKTFFRNIEFVDDFSEIETR